MTTELNDKSYKNALIAIEYRSDAKAAFDSLSDIPKKFRDRFLELLEQNPKGPVNEYLNIVEKEHNEWLRPYNDDQINLAFQEARKLGFGAETEFRKAIDVLGDSAQPNEVLEKIKEKLTQGRELSKDPLNYIVAKWGCNSSEELMKIFGITYNSGKYIYEGTSYETFLDAAIRADEEAVHDNVGIAETQNNNPETSTKLYDAVENNKKGFLSKLVSGDLGLGKTYWLYGVLVGVIANIFSYLLNSFGSIVVFVIIYTAYEIPVLIGIWNAADKYKGEKVWAVLAKIATILGWVILVFVIVGLLRLVNA